MFSVQINVMLPETQAGMYGALRVMIKDNNDDPAISYLDSDGVIGDSRPRGYPEHAEVNDGQWHMITIASRVDKAKYALPCVLFL